MPAGSTRQRSRRRPPPPSLPSALRQAPPRRRPLLRLPPPRRLRNNFDRHRNDRKFPRFGLLAPSKRHGVIRVVKSRGRVMLDLPLTWSDLGDGSASLPFWPLMV